jgi:hypothetical protein
MNVGRSRLVPVLLAALVAASGCKSTASSDAPARADAAAAVSSASTSNDAGRHASYVDVEGRFEIDMPGKPLVEEAPPKLGSGPPHMASVKSGDATYYAMWMDFPVGTPVNVPGAFDGAQNNICKQDSVVVKSLRDFTLSEGIPARDVVAESTTATPWKDTMRFVWVAPRMYSIFVRGVTNDARAQAYLASFKITSLATAGPWVTGTLGSASASFPGTPTEGKTTQPGPDGPTDVRMLRFTRGALDVGLQLVVDPRPGLEANVEIERRLDVTRTSFLQTFGATRVAKEERVVLAGHPARRVRYELGDGRGDAELVLAFPRKDTLVMAMVALAEAHTATDAADGKRFLDSFLPAPPR